MLAYRESDSSAGRLAVPIDDVQTQAFIDACTSPQPIEHALALLSRDPRLAGACNSRGTSALHRAAAGGSPRLIRALVENNAMIDQQDSDGDPPIRRAFNESKTDAVLCMLELGANPNCTFSAIGNKHGLNPLTTALNRGMWPVVAKLLALDTEPPPAYGLTALHQWVVRCAFPAYGAPQAPQTIVDADTLAQKDVLGRTPLLLASFLGCKPCAEHFLAVIPRSATGSADLDGRTPLHLLPAGAAAMVQMLVDHGSFVEARDKGLSTPLISAARIGAVDVVQALLEAKADVDAADKLDRTAVFFACMGASREHEDVAMTLLDAGASRRVREFGTRLTLLHLACRNQLSRVALALLEREALDESDALSLSSSPFLPAIESSLSALPLTALATAADSAGRTALHFACVQCETATVRALLDGPGRACIDAVDDRLATPLYAACEAEAEAAALLLLEAGARMELFDARDVRPVHLACQHGMSAVVERMLDLGAEIENHEDGLNTVMHFAARGGLAGRVRAWLEAGASLHHKGRGARVRMGEWRNKEGRTPFMEAIRHAQREVVEVCLQLGADPVPCDEDGEPVKLNTTAEIADLLRAADQRRTYFHGRYQREPGPPAHATRTCVVYFAVDHEQHRRPVALKFMLHREQFEREVCCRQDLALDPAYVVSVLRTHVSEAGEAGEAGRSAAESARRGLAGYPFCLVMERGDRSLAAALAHEHHVPNPMEVQWGWVVDTFRQAAEAVQHLHERGVLHGDIKPLNIVRVQAPAPDAAAAAPHSLWKLIDLDAAARLPDRGAAPAAASASAPLDGWAGAKYSSAYIPPELVWIDASGAAHVRDGQHPAQEDASAGGETAAKPLPYARVAASGAQDVWALGCILFQLSTGMTLFHANTQDNISQEALVQLAEWSDGAMKDKAVAVIQHRLARHLVAQMLHADPARRPSLEQVLRHPFVGGGEVAGRLAEEEAKWDVFLSYRVASDGALAERVHAMLSVQGFRVFLDKVCLEPGRAWEEGFVDALSSSSLYLAILTPSALFGSAASAADMSRLTAHSPCDNLLLELQMALALRDAGMLRGIHTLQVADTGDPASLLDGFGADQGREAVAAVSERLGGHLARQGIAPPQTALGPRGAVEQVLQYGVSAVPSDAAEVLERSLHSAQLRAAVLAAGVAPQFDAYLVFAAEEDAEAAAEVQRHLIARGVRARCVKAGAEAGQLWRSNPTVFAPVLSNAALEALRTARSDSPANPLVVECHLALTLCSAPDSRLRFIHPLFVGRDGAPFSCWNAGSDAVVEAQQCGVQRELDEWSGAARSGSLRRTASLPCAPPAPGLSASAWSTRETLQRITKNQGWQVGGSREQTAQVAALKVAAIVLKIDGATDLHERLQQLQDQALQWKRERDHARSLLLRLQPAAGGDSQSVRRRLGSGDSLESALTTPLQLDS